MGNILQYEVNDGCKTSRIRDVVRTGIGTISTTLLLQKKNKRNKKIKT